ncbi:MAG: hypothetical protein ACKOB4_05285 [Acidobacteriota bacterium]
MAWIKTIPFEEAEGPLRDLMHRQRELYPREYGTPPPVEAIEELRESIVSSHSLLPQVMYHIFAGYGEMLSPALPLSRSQHEMIATMVSVTNHCFY